MSIFERATEAAQERMDSDGSDTPDVARASAATTAQAAEARAAETTVAGETVTITEPETNQGDEDTWLSGAKRYGWPRGREAIEAREIVQTSAMQAITNGIADQLLGGELTFESDQDEPGEAEGAVRDLIRDVLQGPHLMDDDLDDLMAAAVEDMLGPGNAYWQLLPAENDSLPVVSLLPLDPLTIRHNYNRHGYPQDPPYYQAPNAFSSDGLAAMSGLEPVELQKEQIAVMRYPRGRRSHRVYPMSPSIQVRRWLEILANSTTHHNRYYDDNELPQGVFQIMEANGNTVGDVKDEIESASGDPRDVSVIGGGAAQWIELGGTAVNLNIIEEQRWFFQLCLASLGLGKQELGFIEDVNRSNGEVEATRIYKRITGPFAKQFESAFTKIASQFEPYQALDDPFDVRLRFSDPREERAREQRLREMWNAGGLNRRQYYRRRGDEDLAEEDMTVEIDGETIDYGSLPKDVLEYKLRSVRGETPADGDGEDESGDEGGGGF